MAKGILTAEGAKDIITAAFPRFRGMQVELLDDGWDFQVFEVDAGWLFRIPKREEYATKLSMEYKLLPNLADWVSLPIKRLLYLTLKIQIHNFYLTPYLTPESVSVERSVMMITPTMAMVVHLVV